ncbi:MAG TPA: M67 family metallopeptidase [Anaerolineales bacterium]|nr:M67 family metallopeptidase [Anaerolineales bacterium]
MTVILPSSLMRQIQENGERQYPEEGAGLILGNIDEGARRVSGLIHRANSFEPESRGRRYAIDPKQMLEAEQEAESRGMDIVGIFHSHPDHPARPSEFDLAWAMPWYSYIITSVSNGKAGESRSWRLSDDRSSFVEEQLVEVHFGSAEEER